MKGVWGVFVTAVALAGCLGSPVSVSTPPVLQSVSVVKASHHSNPGVSSQHTNPNPNPTSGSEVRPQSGGATATASRDLEATPVTPGKRLLIGVETAPTHFEARQAIRASWGARVDPTSPAFKPGVAQHVDIVFFVGDVPDPALSDRITAEPWVTRLTGFTEAYQNLTAKTLGIIGWANDKGYSHLLKVDDDVYLQIETLMHWMDSIAGGLDNTYAGEFTYEAVVNSEPGSKWFMKDQYPHDVFPPYAFGPCYFLGRNLISLISAQRHVLPLYRVEDAGVAIWLKSSGGAPVVEALDNMYYQAECWNEFAVFTTPVNAAEMIEMDSNLRSFGNICGDAAHPLVLKECQDRRCHCYPLPDTGACQDSLANEEYHDYIPR